MLTIGRVRRDERGVGVVTALGVVLAVFAVGTVWTQTAMHEIHGSGSERSREQALAAAEAGLNQAMSRFSADPNACTNFSGTLPKVGQFEVEFTSCPPVLSTTPLTSPVTRTLVARGWAPSKTAAVAQGRRQLEQQVRLLPLDGFRFALFAAPGGIVGNNNIRVTGDVYSASDLDLSNYSRVFGDVQALGDVIAANQTTVDGMIHNRGNVNIDHAQATVLGDIWSAKRADGTGGNVTVKGQVKGEVRAATSVNVVSPSGSVAKQPPTIDPTTPPPRTLVLPNFSWDPAHYAPEPVQGWTTGGAFKTYWNSNRSAFPAGHHRISTTTSSTGSPAQTAPCASPTSPGSVDLDQSWTMTGDVTIVSDGPVTVSRDIANSSSSQTRTLTVVSCAPGDAIRMTNQITLPDSIRVLFYAPNGCVDFRNLKHFSGVVYADCIKIDQQFTLKFEAPDKIRGFDWSASAATRFEVEATTFSEVPFTG